MLLLKIDRMLEQMIEQTIDRMSDRQNEQQIVDVDRTNNRL